MPVSYIVDTGVHMRRHLRGEQDSGNPVFAGFLTVSLSGMGIAQAFTSQGRAFTTIKFVLAPLGVDPGYQRITLWLVLTHYPFQL
jgi:hypothetical protein